MPPEPVELEADRERLVQVLCNLIGNAAKYTPAGGDDRAHGQLPRPSGSLAVSVKDNGIGIPPASSTEIFDLFARVDQSLERQGGLGIGLTLVRQLVELHGGTVEARSDGHRARQRVHPDAARRRPGRRRERDGAAQPPAGAPRSASWWRTTTRTRSRAWCCSSSWPGTTCTALVRRRGRDRRRRAAAPGRRPARHRHAEGQRLRGRAAYPRARLGRARSTSSRSPAGGSRPTSVAAQEAGFDAHLVKPVPPETLDRLLAALSASREPADAATASRA